LVVDEFCKKGSHRRVPVGVQTRRASDQKLDRTLRSR
jgi:hypothetical protein